MPEPFNKKISLNNFIYTKLKEPQYKWLCVLNPNLITILNVFISTLIGYLFYYNKSIYWLIFLTLINRFLDILDGSVARKCNKTSKLGQKLDILGDIYFCLLILVLLYLKISTEYPSLKWLVIIIGAYFLINVYYIVKNNNYEIININDFRRFLHDNTIIIGPLAILFAYFISIKFSK